LVQEYIQNHRGRPKHSFLVNSAKNKPLSVCGVTAHFEAISASLPPELRKEMKDHTGGRRKSP
jgi:hypothetical protein